MPLEFQISPLDIQNPTVGLLELDSTPPGAPGPIAPYHSNKLIQTDQPFKVVFGWDQVANSWQIDGDTWHFDIYLEQMGPKEAPPAGGHFTDDVPVDGTDGPKSFTMQIAANAVDSGLYRVTVCQQLYNQNEPRAVVMFGDVGLVRFYEEQ